MTNAAKSFLVCHLIVLLALATGCVGAAATAIGDSAPSTPPFLEGSLINTRSMKAQRASHTATLLDDGKVLITGGFVGGERSIATTEIYDPATSAFSPGVNMGSARSSHTATRLPDGKVLIAGGFDGGYLDTAEIFDPSTGKFTPAPNMTMARSDHVAILLTNGKVLLAGGVGTGWTFLASSEIYDPASNSFKASGAMTTARESHTVTLIDDGKVLITGGHQGRRSAIQIYSSCEIYDPAKGTFTSAGNMSVKRHKHDAVRLADGRVLIVGGSDERDSAGAYRNAEVFDPKTKMFSAVRDLNASRYKLRGTSLLLSNGKVLVAGGANRAEVFDPKTNSFSLATGDMGSTRLFSTATLLKNGNVLITGGYDLTMAVSSSAWMYRP